MADETYLVSIDLVGKGQPLVVQSAPIIQKPAAKSSVWQGIVAGVMASVLAKGIQNIKFRVPKRQPKKTTEELKSEYTDRIEKANAKLEEELRRRQDEYFKAGQEDARKKGYKYIRELEKENDKLIDEMGKKPLFEKPKKKTVLGVQDARVFRGAEQITVDRRIMTQKKELRADLKSTIKKLDATQSMLKETENELKASKQLTEMQKLEIKTQQQEIVNLQKEVLELQHKEQIEKVNRSVGQQIRRQREAIQMGATPKPIDIPADAPVGDPRLSKSAAWAVIEEQKKMKGVVSGGGVQVEPIVAKPTQVEPRKSKKFQMEEAEEEIDMEDYIEIAPETKIIDKMKKQQRATVTIE